MTEIARRLQRVEDKLDERIATVDMVRAIESGLRESLTAQDKLVQARELGHLGEISGLRDRVKALESSNQSLQRMVIGAFLVLIVNILVLVITIASRGGT